MSATLWAGSATAQAPADPTALVPTRDRTFLIPFRVDPVEKPRLREVQLYWSSDRGNSWQPYARSDPNQEHFTFSAPGDGEFWFAVRTTDFDGRQYPPTMAGVRPGTRVLVDTQPPRIRLRAVKSNDDKVSLDWWIDDSSADLASIRLDYSAAGAGTWEVLPVDRQIEGRAAWVPRTRGPIDVRLSVLDQAGNEGVEQITMSGLGGIPAVSGESNGASRFPSASRAMPDAVITPDRPPLGSARPLLGTGDPPTPTWRGPPTALPSPPQESAPPPTSDGLVDHRRSMPRTDVGSPAMTQLVNSTRFNIDYQSENVGKSGIESIALYQTVDGRLWEYYGDDEDRESPFPVRVASEGVYGFTIVARSGAGVGGDPPATGDPPHAWIEVDITPPQIQLLPPSPGQGSAAGILTIAWSATDRNLAPRSIRLTYSEQPGGDWKTIDDNVDNTGTYQWRIPNEVPFRFFVQIEARDRAGNLGRAVTERPVIVDLARPRIKIKGVSAISNPLEGAAPQ